MTKQQNQIAETQHCMFDDSESSSIQDLSGRSRSMTSIGSCSNTSNLLATAKGGSTNKNHPDNRSVTFANKGMTDHNNIFVTLVFLFGIVAAATILRIGIHGAQLDVMERFQLEANEVSNAIAVSSWHDYETVAMWVHESCHVIKSNNEEDSSTNNKTTIDMDVDVASQIGFCSRAKFRHLYEHVLSMNVPFVAVQYIPNVTHDMREALEYQSMKYHKEHNPVVAEKYVGIKEINLNKQGVVDKIEYSPPKPFYFPVHYMHPLEKNEGAVGIDLYSYEAENIDKALSTGHALLSRRGKLFQDPSQFAVTIIHPGMITSVDLENRATPRALAKLVIRVADIITRAAATLKAEGLSVTIYDVTKCGHEHNKEGDYNSSLPEFLAGADIMSQDNIILQNETVLDDVIKHHAHLSSHGASSSSPLIYMNEDKLLFTATYKLLDREWMIAVQPVDPNNFKPDLTYVILGGTFMCVACTFLSLWLKYHHQREVTMNRIKTQAAKERAFSAIKQVQRERHLNDFIAHEVRNPLSSAIAALSFITEAITSSKTSKQRCHNHEDYTKIDQDETEGVACPLGFDDTGSMLMDDLNVLENSLNYINDLLRNMLDIHRTDTDSFPLKPTKTHLMKDLLEPARAILCVRRRQGGEVDRDLKDRITFEAECDPPNLIANVDRLRLEQILLNLALNSTKFVETGFIRLRAEVVEVADSSNSDRRESSTVDCNMNETIRLIVEDSGPGIPYNKRGHLFEKYQESLDLMNQGTGIGLYICKNLSRLMGATIWLDETYDSQIPGQPGARFVIDLDQPPMYLEVDDCGHRPELDDKEFLLDSIDGVSSLAQDQKIDPESLLPCKETPRGFVAQGSHNSDSTPLPPPSTQTIETNVSMVAPQDDPHSGGCSDSPTLGAIDTTLPSTTTAVKRALLDPMSSIEEGTATTDFPDRLRVLFVDDDATLRKLFARSLHRLAPEWELQEASSGETALDLVELSTKDNDACYDLIFMDMYMASTSQKKQLLGTETVKLLREKYIDGSSRNCIICGLSANDLEQQFLEAGANAFVLKPFPCKKEEMRKEIMRVLRSRYAC